MTLILMTTFVGMGMNLDWTILPLLVLRLVNLTAALPLTRLVITSQLSLLLPQWLLLGSSYRRLPYLAVIKSLLESIAPFAKKVRLKPFLLCAF
jgi:hypothetical protein